ncbi:aldose 1-dehydrogenase [NAD(P)+] [Gammaproteobacteria bacterium]|nr:glucose 1-dehydrogenase [Gammaproteobacteria bacterium]QOJ31171.1 MAG: glucose 1-dehydrogenase [Gammaproteobacteria bacterium]CAG0938889.1 aldose 1-dehydrogenase [NAD(P)+] [Gammaproteobacteria bacterium]
MKAIAVTPGRRDLHRIERPEPEVRAAHDVKMRVVRVGICGTDREEAAGGRALAPPGSSDLVVGHEMLGQVIETGSGVTRVKPGDYAVFTVRRGCGNCQPCGLDRPDMCLTGDYRERGIWGLDGYQAEFAVDHEQYIVCVPPRLEPVGVLCEPLSVAEKALNEAMLVQAVRMPDIEAGREWFTGRRCLVAGLGPIGLLAALALRLRGAEVAGLDVVDAGSARPRWLEAIGGRYLDARSVAPDGVEHTLGEMELIFEATGVPSLAFNLLDALGESGVYVLTGIPGGARPVQIPGGELLRRLVLDNQVMIGSVNAAPVHWQMAVDDLSRAVDRWDGHVAQLITHRHPADDFATALGQHGSEEIKVVLEWGTSGPVPHDTCHGTAA